MTTYGPAQRRYRAKHADKLRALRKERYAKELVAAARRKSTPEGWAKSIIPKIRHRAKANGLECTIEWPHIIPPAVCPVLGLPLTLTGTKSRYNPTAPSVDRFNNAEGYTPDNVRVICVRANVLKKDATLLEIQAIARYMAGG